MPWLFARVATSIPAVCRALNADGGARKTYFLSAGVPRVVTVVSRLTIARSARPSVWAIDPNMVRGSAASRSPTLPSKCTSPPKAIVTGVPVGTRSPSRTGSEARGSPGGEDVTASAGGVAEGDVVPIPGSTGTALAGSAEGEATPAVRTGPFAASTPWLDSRPDKPHPLNASPSDIAPASPTVVASTHGVTASRPPGCEQHPVRTAFHAIRTSTPPAPSLFVTCVTVSG